jgi:phosphatidate phosphatase PAH1
LTAAKPPAAAASADALGPSPLKATTTGSVSLEPSSPGKGLAPLSSLVRASSSPDLISATALEANRVNYSKSLRLPSEELKRWGLAYGMNTIRFNVATSRNGRAACTSRLFLWRSDDKIVISDIDGTITKSDALGHLFQFVGKDWTHSGIANLFTDIARNGYRFLYLTSRAIGQADSTRDYLKGIEQDRYQLPEGPVIMSPDRFFTAVRREVIEGVPEQFKIPCLLDIRRLFTRNNGEGSVDPMALTEAEKAQPCPFYAGFGNRHTDAMSYAAVGIVPARIYIVNPESHLSLQIVTGYRSSYGKLVDLVDYVFPPLNDAIERIRTAKAPEAQPAQHTQKEAEVDYETYNDFYFWRQPLAQPERHQLLLSSASDLHSALAAVDPEGTKLLDANREAEEANADGADDDDDAESVERNDQYYFEKEEEAGLIPFA